MSLLNFNFVMIHIVHKILELIKNHMNHVQNNVFECFLRMLFLKKKLIFYIAYNDGKSKA